MRILLVSGSLPPMKCGVGDYTASLANALAHREDTSVAVLTDVAATPIPSDFDFEVFPVTDGWKMTDVGQIAKVVRRWRPDFIHFQYPTQGYGTRYLPWLLPAFFTMMNLPVVQTWHEYHMETCRRNLLNALLSCGLIAVRPDYKAAMPSWYRWLNRKKHFGFIPNSSAIPRTRLSEVERSSIRSQFAPSTTCLVVYFGFAYPHKRVELLFDIADPLHDYLVLLCDLNSEDEYHKVILNRIQNDGWIDKVTVTGFLPAEDVGRILAAADAVVLPFRDGGGLWNTSIHAAVTQGTFVLTTAHEKGGYHSATNVYYARPDDLAEMSNALRAHMGSKRPETDANQVSEWAAIAEAHIAFYAALSENSQSK
jgi:glycosyltransferase involved in cell wall biosynthesis